MPVYSRSLLLFAILAAAAMVTWVLARNTAREPDATQGDATDAPQGFYMQGAVLFGTDDDGRVPYRIRAERIEQESTAHDTTLVEVRVEYSEQAETPWEITAARGTMTPDRELLDLQSVRLTASSEQRGRLVFESRELNLDLVARTASTRQQVQLRTDECESNARGLNVDLNRDSFELLESTTTCRARAAPVLGLVLLAGPALPQEEPTEIYTYLCTINAGSVVDDVHTCTAGSISDGTTFRLTFGLGTVSNQKRLTTVQSEWQLTDGVRLEFETAVLVADSARFAFDGEGLVQSFELAGTPAELSDYIDGQSEPVRIRATSIGYDRVTGIMSAPGEVEFLDDGNEANAVHGCDLRYGFEDKTYEIGNPECGFRATLAPPAAEDSSTESPDEP